MKTSLWIKTNFKALAAMAAILISLLPLALAGWGVIILAVDIFHPMFSGEEVRQMLLLTLGCGSISGMVIWAAVKYSPSFRFNQSR